MTAWNRPPRVLRRQCSAGGRFPGGDPAAAALRRAGKVGVLSPCYAEHAEAWRRSGYIVREVLEQEVDFFLDSLDVLVVVNPNNPTGLSLTPQRLLDWHAPGPARRLAGGG
jgi:histidinol-phosphate/aromatic aminotransferase/cobyric acid decarboxylase-like protein